MENNYLLDTYVIVQAINSGLELPAARYFISSVTKDEVLSCDSLNSTDKEAIDNIFKNLHILEPNDLVVENATILQKKYGMSISDSAICATAYIYNLTLITNDSVLRSASEITIEPFYFV
jgi:predicted nucleic acid-binding protein